MITNLSDISLALAVWIVHDEYDHVTGVENYISATSLMKPLRQIILTPRVAKSSIPLDVQDLIASAAGKAFHDSIEKAWTQAAAKNLKTLGYPDSLIERVKVNPTDDEVRASNSIVPIYVEQRMLRQHRGYTIGGKFDLVIEGAVEDAKSTSAYTWLHGGKDDDYRLQMSIYRWIDAKQPLRKITEDVGRINFIFTDWQRSAARSNPAYPQKRVEQKEIPLLSLKETEQWIDQKLSLIQKHINSPEAEIPECTDEELWRSDPVYKFYSDASKTSGRSSKNFDNLNDARKHQADKGGKGTVIAVPGSPKRCDYCSAFSICTQKDRYQAL